MIKNEAEILAASVGLLILCGIVAVGLFLRCYDPTGHKPIKDPIKYFGCFHKRNLQIVESPCKRCGRVYKMVRDNWEWVKP